MTEKPTYEALEKRVQELEKKIAEQVNTAEYRKLQATSDESEIHLRALIQAIPDLIWLKDANGKYLACNPRFESFFGAKEADIVGKTDYDFVNRELADFFRHHDKKAMARGGPGKNEEEVTFADDGHQEILETIKTPMYRSRGQLAGVLGIGRDITERKQAEAERERLMAAIEQVGEMIVITDEKGLIQYANPAYGRMTGYSYDQIHGQRLYFYDNEKPDSPLYREAWDTVFKGESWMGRKAVQRRDGSRFMVTASLSTIRDDSGEIVNFVSVKRDITKRLHLEAQFQQAQKMESVGRLAGGVAHDYNNMLGVILGHADLAMQRADGDDPLLAHLKAITDAAHRSTAITRQLLTFARKQTITPRTLNLNATVDGMLKILGRLIGEHIDLIWLPGTDLWSVKMDPSQIDQILANLCINARDAITNVGTLTIETENVCLENAPCCNHGGSVSGAFVLLAVTDDGIGMDAETLDKIFEPFYTTKDASRGTGLGLSTVYGIVQQNNGFIDVYSEPGQGTTFKIYLPRHEGKINGGERLRPAEIPQSHGETVLMVEDDAAIMNVCSVILEKLGYHVLTALTPYSALEAAKQQAGNIDLLLTDVVMPEMNGRDLADRILNLFPEIRVLFMSGYSADVIAHRGILEDGIQFIQKPLTIRELANKVRAVLDRENG